MMLPIKINRLEVGTIAMNANTAKKKTARLRRNALQTLTITMAMTIHANQSCKVPREIGISA